ncbi:hypothetical protein [Rathayibacter sp. AY1E6]|uniref:hypothetical protein n=1 Tax=Rathayibacter sp. AY1E6 TaxID=2080554 RepID=UPI000CE7B107|nr:hypothetical protein [Rathayibacter sp. AY1E6]PPF69932.1 hypothetical protein C5C46_12930 [Rathayibacter sp. AY1E6]
MNSHTASTTDTYHSQSTGAGAADLLCDADPSLGDPDAFIPDDDYGPATALELHYIIQPWPNGPEAYRAVFLDGSYGPASAFVRADA